MQPLPDWVSNGAIVSLQGGQDEIDEKYNYLKEHSVPLAGVWMQDWVGLGSFPEGDRLLWNWQLDKQHYPRWNESRKIWEEDGVHPLIYLNPMISKIEGDWVRERQFEIA